MITIKRFRLLEAAVRDAGFGDTIDWTESITPPLNAEAFASEAIYVICNSGMKNAVAMTIFDRCMEALARGKSATKVFGHPGKASAIDRIWKKRRKLFKGFQKSKDQLAYCENLPWIGEVTKYHLAKNFGLDAAKPDVHLERLARAENSTSQELCERLAKESGYRAATVDTILWRSCAEGILNSKKYEKDGWKAAFKLG